MPETAESVVTIPRETPLHGVRHACSKEAHPKWGVVFCDPFAEEKKCAHRVMVEAARSFCMADIACLRFDYRGTGDAPGEFSEVTPEDWIEDIVASAQFARHDLGVGTLGLLGLRLGATMALLAADACEEVDFVILWEPIINGSQYIAETLRRSMIKAMLTEGDTFEASRVRNGREQEVFDFDGYRVSAEAKIQIEAIDLLDRDTGFAGPSLVVNIGTREQPKEPFAQLASILGGQVVAVRQEPFWNRIGLVDSTPVVEATELWLAEKQASWIREWREDE